jgi:hypothetical protein
VFLEAAGKKRRKAEVGESLALAVAKAKVK